MEKQGEITPEATPQQRGEKQAAGAETRAETVDRLDHDFTKAAADRVAETARNGS